MRKLNITFLVIALGFVVFISSCGSWKKMPAGYENLNFSVKPDPLEMHPNSNQEQKVQVTINADIPPEYFDKNAIVIVTPVIKSLSGKEYELKSVTYQGEKVRDNNDVIPYKTGKSIRYSEVFDYNPDMMLSELIVKATARHAKKGDKVELGSKKIADGIITTPLLARRGLEVDNLMNKEEKYDAAAEFGKIATIPITLPEKSSQPINADIHYEMQRSDIRATESKSEDITKFFTGIKDAETNELIFTGADVKSYASPDGPTDLNTDLSKNRASAIDKFIASEIAKLNKKNPKPVNVDGKIKSETISEDWDGFQEIMQNPNTSVRDKELILRVLKMYSDPEVREKEIKNIAAAYEELKTVVLPQLRRSQIRFNYETAKKTDEQILQLASSNPKELTLEEMLYGASVTNDLNKKVEILTKAQEMYPKCYRVANNLGVAYTYQKKADEAKKQFELANELKKNSYSTNNLGVLELSEKQYDAAEATFNNVLELPVDEATSNANYNLGYISLLKGDYNNANRYFGATKSFNAALAQLLSGDANKALTTLNSMGEVDHAFYYYLKAVIGARLKNESLIFANLEKAVAKESKLKDYAKHDIEFGKYFDKPNFQKIVQ